MSTALNKPWLINWILNSDAGAKNTNPKRIQIIEFLSYPKEGESQIPLTCEVSDSKHFIKAVFAIDCVLNFENLNEMSLTSTKGGILILNSFKLKIHREHQRLVSCHLEIDSVTLVGSMGCYTIGNPMYIMDDKQVLEHIRTLYESEKAKSKVGSLSPISSIELDGQEVLEEIFSQRQSTQESNEEEYKFWGGFRLQLKECLIPKLQREILTNAIGWEDCHTSFTDDIFPLQAIFCPNEASTEFPTQENLNENPSLYHMQENTYLEGDDHYPGQQSHFEIIDVFNNEEDEKENQIISSDSQASLNLITQNDNLPRKNEGLEITFESEGLMTQPFSEEYQPGTSHFRYEDNSIAGISEIEEESPQINGWQLLNEENSEEVHTKSGETLQNDFMSTKQNLPLPTNDNQAGEQTSIEDFQPRNKEPRSHFLERIYSFPLVSSESDSSEDDNNITLNYQPTQRSQGEIEELFEVDNEGGASFDISLSYQCTQVEENSADSPLPCTPPVHLTDNEVKKGVMSTSPEFSTLISNDSQSPPSPTIGTSLDSHTGKVMLKRKSDFHPDIQPPSQKKFIVESKVDNVLKNFFQDNSSLTGQQAWTINSGLPTDWVHFLYGSLFTTNSI